MGGGKGGGGSDTTTVVQSPQIPSWLSGAAQNYLAALQGLTFNSPYSYLSYDPLMNQSTAPFTPTQQQGMQDILGTGQGYQGVVDSGLAALLNLAGGGQPQVNFPPLTAPGGVQPGGIPNIPGPVPGGVSPNTPLPTYPYGGGQYGGGGGVTAPVPPSQYPNTNYGGGNQTLPQQLSGSGYGGQYQQPASSYQQPQAPAPPQTYDYVDYDDFGNRITTQRPVPGSGAPMTQAAPAAYSGPARGAMGVARDMSGGYGGYIPSGTRVVSEPRVGVGPGQGQSTLPAPAGNAPVPPTPAPTTTPAAPAGATAPPTLPTIVGDPQLPNAPTTTPPAQAPHAAQTPQPAAMGTQQINPYLDQYYQQAADTMTKLYQNATAPSAMSSAVAQGAFGGSADAMQRAMGQFQLGQNLANLGAQIYEPAWNQQQQLGFQYSQLGQQGNLAQQQMALSHQMQAEQLAQQAKLAADQGDLQKALQTSQLAAQEQMQAKQLAAQSGMLGQQLSAEQAMQGQSLAAQQAMQQSSLAQQAQMQGQQLAAQQALASQQMQLQQQAMAQQNALGLAQLQSNTQLGALGMLPEFASMLYTPGQQMLGVGGMQQNQLQNILNNISGGAQQMQQYPYNVLGQYGGGLTSMMGPFSGTSQVSTQPSQGSKK